MRDDVIAAHRDCRTGVRARAPAAAVRARPGSCKAMRRTYSQERYLALAGRLRDEVPGHRADDRHHRRLPGRDRGGLRRARSRSCEQVGYDHAFTFVYSPRRGTDAAAMDDQVPDEVKRERMERLVEPSCRSTRGAATPRWSGRCRRCSSRARPAPIRSTLVRPHAHEQDRDRPRRRRARHAGARCWSQDATSQTLRGRRERARARRRVSDPARTVVAVFGPTAVGKSELALALARAPGRRDRVRRRACSCTAACRRSPRNPARPSAPPCRTTWSASGRSIMPARSASTRRWRTRAIDDCAAGDRGRRHGPLPARRACRAAPAAAAAAGPARAARRPSTTRLGADAAHALLASRDPAAAARVHPNDRRRVVRALELCELGSSLVPDVDRLWTSGLRRPALHRRPGA